MSAEIDELRNERDAWFEASYALAGVVASKNEMHTLRLLRLRQDSWRNLAMQAVHLVKRASSRQLDGLRAAIVAFKASVGVLVQGCTAHPSSLWAPRFASSASTTALSCSSHPLQPPDGHSLSAD
jgi:hypothetical protein